MIHKLALAAAASAVALVGAAGVANAQARDQIRIVGSSTVFPFTTAVSETFGRGGQFKTPIVESTGTGGGMKLFCGGVGPQHPDITNASRRIKASEVESCAKNGVTEIVEMLVGYDGLSIAHSKKSKPMNVTLGQLWLALAKEVPVGGKLVANPYKKWSDVDASLPAVEIEMMGPPPTSGTRDSFNELIMEAGCHTIKEVAAIVTDKKEQAKVCMEIREDGAYIEAGENDNLIVQKLAANPNAFGAFGYSFYDQNRDKLQSVAINGVPVTLETVQSGKYPVSRSMYIYAKKAHIGVIPGIREFLAEYSSERALSEDGYLADKGLIPDTKAKRETSRAAVMNLSLLKM